MRLARVATGTGLLSEFESRNNGKRTPPLGGFYQSSANHHLPPAGTQSKENYLVAGMP
jgi:hypothetical protein